MSNSTGGFTSILPGTRVRTQDGVVGTVERLEGQGADGQPEHMIVRSEDGQWRYRIPLMLVGSVTQGTFHPVAQLNLTPNELTTYIMGRAGAGDQTESQMAQVAPAAAQSGQWAPDDPNAVLRIPLVMEELVPEKHSVVLGKVHIHKGIETVNQDLTVPIYHEEAVIEHIPVDQYDSSAPTNPNETIIPVMEEQLVIEKRSVIKEYIRVRKNIVTQQQDVHEVVRREFVEVTEQRDATTNANGSPLLRNDQTARPASPASPTGAAAVSHGQTPTT